MASADPAVNTPWPSRGTRIESCDFIKKSKRCAGEQKAATVLPNRTAAT